MHTPPPDPVRSDDGAPTLDVAQLEAKWQARWADAKVFEAERKSDAPKLMITVAWPYPSGPMHVGHGRTYTIPDVIARFHRMEGKRVLFPMGWHLTGSPIVGATERIRKQDPAYVAMMRGLYAVSDQDLARMVDPVAFARYFTSESPLGYRKGMQGLGYSVDWRRECTSIDPHFSTLVRWQYRTLRAKGLVAPGSHPVKFCPAYSSSVTDHDLSEGEGASIQEFTLIHYTAGELHFPAATLRPETIFGATNLWLHPQAEYVEAEVTLHDGSRQRWVISADAAYRLSFQGYGVRELTRSTGAAYIGQMVQVPLCDRSVPILPATFVDVTHTSGVVASVPAHAPFDLIALQELQQAGAPPAGVDAAVLQALLPMPIVAINGDSSLTARTLTKMGITSQHQREALDEATHEVYKAEFAKGVMTVGFVRGQGVGAARDAVRQKLQASGHASRMWEFTLKPVIHRSGAPCVVGLVKDQWFLRYGDEAWTASVREHLHKVSLIPADTLTYYENVLEWLQDWPCTRAAAVGMGTMLPWDSRWLIESLSDSTIYMAYYTIAHRITQVDPKRIDDSFYEYLFYGTGDADALSVSMGVTPRDIEALRAEFEYWYPLDWRVSANELIPNHLTFMLYHHNALLPHKQPRGIANLGMGILEGAKMSSSKGNILPVSTAVTTYGADAVRLYLMNICEPWQDFDWRNRDCEIVRRQLDRFYAYVDGLPGRPPGRAEPHLDTWLRSRVAGHIAATREALEGFSTRKAVQHGFFYLANDLRWYERRGGDNRELLLSIAQLWVRLLCPIVPHLSEELWSRIGPPAAAMCSLSPYPHPPMDWASGSAETLEGLVEQLVEDIGQIYKVLKREHAPRVVLLCAPAWKRAVLRTIVDAKSKGPLEVGALMKSLMADQSLRAHGKDLQKWLPKIIEQVRTRDVATLELLLQTDEAALWRSALPFLQAEFADVFEVVGPDEGGDAGNKRGAASPGRPAIYVEGGVAT